MRANQIRDELPGLGHDLLHTGQLLFDGIDIDEKDLDLFVCGAEK